MYRVEWYKELLAVLMTNNLTVLKIKVEVGGKKLSNSTIYLYCVVPYEPSQVSARLKMQKTLVADGHGPKPASLVELPHASGVEGQKEWC